MQCFIFFTIFCYSSRTIRQPIIETNIMQGKNNRAYILKMNGMEWRKGKRVYIKNGDWIIMKIESIIILIMKNQKKQDTTVKRANIDAPPAAQRPMHRPHHNGASKNPSKNAQNGKMPSVLPHSPSASKLNSHHQRQRPQQPAGDSSKSHSNMNMSRARQSDSFMMVDRVVQLHERLKNIHHFYKSRIEDEKAKVNQRNEVFMGIVEEMQRSHNQKVASLRKMVEEAEGEKKDVGLVDERMNEIKGSIDEILKQSADLKAKNERLQRQINEKAHSLREKEEELGKLKEELMDARNQLESFERLNLRQNKRNKEITAMIDKASDTIASKG